MSSVLPFNSTSTCCATSHSDPNDWCILTHSFIIFNLLETLFDQLRSFVEQEGLPIDDQYWFRSRLSACHPLALVTHTEAASLDSQGETCLALVNVPKFSDQFRHESLLAKLLTFGFSSFLSPSFLNGSELMGVLSLILPIHVGVSYDWLLASILFFIHRLPSVYYLNPIHSFVGDSVGHFFVALFVIQIPNSVVTVVSPVYLPGVLYSMLRKLFFNSFWSSFIPLTSIVWLVWFAFHILSSCSRFTPLFFIILILS